MTYIDQLRNEFKELYSYGYYDGELLKEIKNLDRLFKLLGKFQVLDKEINA